MALTKPRIGQLDTSVFAQSDPITVLHQGATLANVDVGFLFNRANGLVSNVALYWSELANSFVTSFTSNSGVTNSNISASSYANLTIGSLLSINGNIYLNGVAGTAGQMITATSSGTAWSSSSFTGGYVASQSTFGSNLIANSATTSTSTTTGALVVVGGAGVSGNLYVGGVYIGAGGTNGLFWAANNVVVSSGGGTTFTGGYVASQSTFGSNLIANSATTSTSTTTGALVVVGGVGVSGALNIGGTSTFTGATTLATATAGGLQAQAIGNVTPGTGNFTTTATTNFSTGNAVITGGSITGAASGTFTTLQATNFSTANAVITGGSVNGAPIGAGSASTGAFTTGTFSSTLGVTGNLTVTGNVLPSANITYNLGSPTARWKDLYLSGTTIDLGGTTISASAAGMTLIAINVTNGNITTGYFGSLNTANAVITGGYISGVANITSSGTIIASILQAGTIGNANAVLYGTLNSSSASQPNVTTLAGLTSVGTIGVTTTAAGDFTINGCLTVNGTTNTINNTTIETTEFVQTIDASVVRSATVGNIGANHVGTGTYLTSLNASNLSSGTVPSAQLSGSYTGITAVGTVTSLTSSGNIVAASATTSTSTTTGALVVVGGAGVSGNLYVGGVYIGAGGTNGLFWSANNTAVSTGGGTAFTGGVVATNIFASANIVANSATISTSNVTGAIVVSNIGGIGVGGNLYVGNRVGYVWTNNNASSAYTFFNNVTASLDTVFG